MDDKKKPGLWANIHAKKERGEAPAKPGQKAYPDAKNWKKVTAISEKKGTAAWQKSEGKNPEGGLNAKGRASLKAQGHDIKRPQPEGGPRKDSFCARMKGMKAKLTSSETARDPDSRINKSLRKWKCGSADFGNFDFFKTSARELPAMSNSEIVLRAFGNRSFNKQANPILDSITNAGAGAVNSLGGLYDRIGSGISSGASSIGDSVTGAGANAINSLGGLYDRIGRGASNIGDKVTGAGAEAVNSIGGMYDRIGKGLSDTPNRLAGAVNSAGSMYDRLDPVSRNAILGALVGGGTGGIANAVMGDKKKSLLGRLGAGALGGAAIGGGGAALGTYAGEKLKNPLSNAFEGAKSKIKDLRSKLPGSKKEDKPEAKSEEKTKEKKSSAQGFQKKALLEAALDHYRSLDPTAQAALLGAGGGAALGGIGNVLFGKRKPGVGILGRLGRGALAGGALGGAAGAGLNELAIRRGMGRTGADRDMYLSGNVDNASDFITPPVDYINKLLPNRPIGGSYDVPKSESGFA